MVGKIRIESSNKEKRIAILFLNKLMDSKIVKLIGKGERMERLGGGILLTR